MIEVSGLYKNFDQIQAVRGVSFKVNKGEILGFLGPNGAGKSTTMKMITCFLGASAGDVLVEGESIHTNSVSIRQKIGYMPENSPLYDDMYVKEFLMFIGAMRGLSPAQAQARIFELAKICAIESVITQKIETLSKGYKKRVAFAQALIHDPPILILDEPTDGLDPNQKHEVRKLIQDLSKNKCIILSTHILEEVEAVCSRAIIISQGRICFDGTPKELKDKSNAGHIDDVFRALTTGAKIEGVNL